MLWRAALGFMCIGTVGGVMQGGWNESGWVRIGESLTPLQGLTCEKKTESILVKAADLYSK